MSPPTTPPARTRRCSRPSSPPTRAGRRATGTIRGRPAPCELLCDRLGALAAAPVLTGTAANVLSLELVLQPLRGGDLRADGAHRGRRVRSARALPRLQARARRRRRRQAHARAGRRARARRRRPAPGAGRRRLDLAADRARHGLHADELRALVADGPRRTASRCTSTARACRWRPRRSDARSRRPPVRPTSTSSASAARSAARSAPRRSSSTARGSPTASRSSASRRCSSRASCASSARSYVALLEDDLWRELASTANAMARRMSDGLGQPGVERRRCRSTRTRSSSASRHRHAPSSPGRYAFGVWEGELARFMAAWDSTPAIVDAFVAELQRAVSAARLEV